MGLSQAWRSSCSCAGGGADGGMGGVGFVFRARRPGEGEGLECGGGRVAGVVAFAEPSAHAQRPDFVQRGVEDAEEVVVVAGD